MHENMSLMKLALGVGGALLGGWLGLKTGHAITGDWFGVYVGIALGGLAGGAGGILLDDFIEHRLHSDRTQLLSQCQAKQVPSAESRLEHSRTVERECESKQSTVNHRIRQRSSDSLSV